VNRISSPLPSKWIVIVLATATLALAGCGRKGPLDLPPNAPPSASAADDVERPAAKGSVFDPSYGADAPAAAPKGRKKSFVLDPLLD
jgi:predicted small lipoprotein YifL